MQFSSPIFLFVFLPAALLLHGVAPRAARNVVLLLLSLLFYAWNEPDHVAVMLLVIGVNWLAGLAIAARRGTPRARLVLALTVAFDLAVLGWFKYAQFLAGALDHWFAAPERPLIGALGIALPAGISFYLFQAISYVVDVHRGSADPQRRLAQFALFIALFPQLVAGPILRYAPFAPQLGARTVALADFAEGVRRFVRGLVKKVLIADVLATWCDLVFALPPGALPLGLAWGGTLVFTLQVYFDFSGYTDMAIGLGRMLGFRFPENFVYPYLARSVREFWRRWHITLTSWLGDYLLPALGTAYHNRLRRSLSIFVLFVCCGLWHGASWHFVVWGAYHGAFVVFERHGMGAVLERLPRLAGIVYLQLVLAFHGPLFRCATVDEALRYQGAMLGLGAGPAPASADLQLDAVQVGAIVLAIVFSLPVRPFLARVLASWLARPLGGAVVASAYLGMFALAVAWLAAGTWRTFLYFRF